MVKIANSCTTENKLTKSSLKKISTKLQIMKIGLISTLMKILKVSQMQGRLFLIHLTTCLLDLLLCLSNKLFKYWASNSSNYFCVMVRAKDIVLFTVFFLVALAIMELLILQSSNFNAGTSGKMYTMTNNKFIWSGFV